jgi:hypothetical protein
MTMPPKSLPKAPTPSPMRSLPLIVRTALIAISGSMMIISISPHALELTGGVGSGGRRVSQKQKLTEEEKMTQQNQAEAQISGPLLCKRSVFVLRISFPKILFVNKIWVLLEDFVDNCIVYPQ